MLGYVFSLDAFVLITKIFFSGDNIPLKHGPSLGMLPPGNQA